MENQNYLDLVYKAGTGAITTREMQILMAEMASQVNEANKNSKRAIEIGEQIGRTQRDHIENSTLSPAECNELQKAVRKKGVSVMGGKSSPAYDNKELRKKVFRDIHYEVKRQYDLVDEVGRQKSYTHLKHNQLSGAKMIIDSYVLPIALENEINAENEIGDIDED